jgi:hypothetical protein
VTRVKKTIFDAMTFRETSFFVSTNVISSQNV